MGAMMGIATIVTLLACNRFQPRFVKFSPAPLVAVFFGSGIANVFIFPIQFVEVPGSMLDALRWVQPAQVKSLMDPALLPVLWMEAFTLVFIASAETLLSTPATDMMHKGPRANYAREPPAQGVGNLMCGVGRRPAGDRDHRAV